MPLLSLYQATPIPRTKLPVPTSNHLPPAPNYLSPHQTTCSCTKLPVYEEIKRMVVYEEATYKLTKYIKKGPIETDRNTITIEIIDEKQINKEK